MEKLIKNYSEQEKKAYVGVLAYLAKADGVVSHDEILKTHEFGKELSLSESVINEIVDGVNSGNKDAVKEYVSVLSKSELRFSLIKDMFFLGYADRNLSDGEVSNINFIASILRVNDEELDALRSYVERVVKFSKVEQKFDFKKLKHLFTE